MKDHLEPIAKLQSCAGIFFRQTKPRLFMIRYIFFGIFE